MLSLLFQRYGFYVSPGFGIGGIVGILIGLIILIVVCVLLWKIAEIVLRKLGVDADWVMVIKLVMTLLIFLAFCHFFGFY